MLKQLPSLICGFCCATPLLGQDDFTTWFNQEVRSYHYYDLQAGFSPDASTDGGDDLAWRQLKAAGLYTVQHNEIMDLVVWGSYQDVAVDSAARLTNNVAVPDHLSNTRIGVTGRYVQDNWLLGMSAMLQSNGDSSFGDNEQGAEISLFGQYQWDQQWSGWLVLQYEGLIQDELVLGAGINYENEQVKLRLGFPWSQAEWKISEEFATKFIYYGGPWYADVMWTWAPRWRSGLGFQQRHDGFYREQRADDDHQFQFIQYQADVFVTHEFNNYKYLTARLGWMFDRVAFEDDPYEDDGANRLEIDDAPILELAFSCWF